jgi:hypothetical protein
MEQEQRKQLEQEVTARPIVPVVAPVDPRKSSPKLPPSRFASLTVLNADASIVDASTIERDEADESAAVLGRKRPLFCAATSDVALDDAPRHDRRLDVPTDRSNRRADASVSSLALIDAAEYVHWSMAAGNAVAGGDVKDDETDETLFESLVDRVLASQQSVVAAASPTAPADRYAAATSGDGDAPASPTTVALFVEHEAKCEALVCCRISARVSVGAQIAHFRERVQESEYDCCRSKLMLIVDSC